MTSRSRQARRTPHSSSGNINFGSPSPEGQYARHHEYTQHSSQSNPSLPSLGSGAAAGIPAQERIVKNLVDKLNVKVSQSPFVKMSLIWSSFRAVALSFGCPHLRPRGRPVLPPGHRSPAAALATLYQCHCLVSL